MKPQNNEGFREKILKVSRKDKHQITHEVNRNRIASDNSLTNLEAEGTRPPKLSWKTISNCKFNINLMQGETQ